MALRYSFGLGEAADRIDAAIADVLASGLRTADIARGRRASSRPARWATRSSPPSSAARKGSVERRAAGRAARRSGLQHLGETRLAPRLGQAQSLDHAGERRLVDCRARRGADDAPAGPPTRGASRNAAQPRSPPPASVSAAHSIGPRGAGERFRRAEPFDRGAAGGRRLRRRDEQADRRPSPAVPPQLDPQRRAGAVETRRRSSASLRPGPARSRRVSWLIWSAFDALERERRRGA